MVMGKTTLKPRWAQTRAHQEHLATMKETDFAAVRNFGLYNLGFGETLSDDTVTECNDGAALQMRRGDAVVPSVDGLFLD
jgi:hypothetical protein